MAEIRIKKNQLKGLLQRLKKWADTGYEVSVDKATDKITKKYKEQMSAGMDGAGKAMKKVKRVTMDMPIRFGSDPSIRKEVNRSRNPLKARGQTIASIKKTKVGKSFEIQPSTPKGKIVINYNAGAAKTKRDPLIVSDIQGKIIEKELLKSLDKALR